MIKKSMVILCFILSACTTKKQANKENDPRLVHPQYNDNHYYESLNLDRLPQSTDSFHIRFWLTYTGLIDSGKIVSLRGGNGNWYSGYIGYRFKNDSRLDQVNLISNVKLSESPKGGWKQLLHNLEKIGVFSLSEGDPKKTRGLCNDANILKVELIREGIYSKYTFKCFDAFEDQTQVIKVLNALTLLETEFGFPITPFLAGPLSKD